MSDSKTAALRAEVISHLAVQRCLYAYFTGTPMEAQAIEFQIAGCVGFGSLVVFGRSAKSCGRDYRA